MRENSMLIKLKKKNIEGFMSSSMRRTDQKLKRKNDNCLLRDPIEVSRITNVKFSATVMVLGVVNRAGRHLNFFPQGVS